MNEETVNQTEAVKICALAGCGKVVPRRARTNRVNWAQKKYCSPDCQLRASAARSRLRRGMKPKGS